MRKILLLCTCAVVAAGAAAQYGDLGMATPADFNAPIDAPAYHGEAFDMSGGYQIGDTVSNFTLYDQNGERVELYEMLAGEKPVVVVNGSVTCPRFADVFRSDVQSGEYVTVRNFIVDQSESINWIFVYGLEAHPGAGACPSNCPPMSTTDTLVYQAETYGQRLGAVASWNNATDLTFPFHMFADNPDNAVYNAFFERPSGMVALNCDGTVALRADWLVFTLIEPLKQEELLTWGAAHSPCTIEWEGNEPTDPEVADVEETANAFPIRVWPNPVESGAWVQLELPSSASRVRLLNMTGAAVAEVEWNATRWQVPALKPGCYFIELTDVLGTRQTQRLLIH